MSGEFKRTVHYTRLVTLAAETFGSRREAVLWMDEKNALLGYRTPSDMAETVSGARAVYDLLIGLQRGHPV